MPPLKVVVYTPAFNRASWIQGCIESVAAQDYKAKLHLVVDDRSTDDTFDTTVSLLTEAQQRPAPPGAERLMAGWFKGSRVLVARLGENLGPAGARNWAIRAAAPDTDLLANLDSDDRYRPGYLSGLVEPFQHEEIGVVYCDYEVINHDSQTVVREFKEPYSRKRLLEDCLLCNNSVVRKAALEAVGGYDPQMRVAEDWDLWLRISQHYLFYHVPECLLELHAGQHGSANTVPAERWQADRQRIAQKMMGQT